MVILRESIIFGVLLPYT